MFTKTMRKILVSIFFSISLSACNQGIDSAEVIRSYIDGQKYVRDTYGWEASFQWKEGELFTLIVYKDEVELVEASKLHSAAIEVCALMYQNVPPMVSVLIVGDNEK